MFFVADSFWVSLWCYILRVLGFIFVKFLRSSAEASGEVVADFSDACEKPEENRCANANEEMGPDEIGRIEIPKMETEVGSVSNACTSKYEFCSGNSLCAFIEEPETMSFTVQEMFVIAHVQSPNRQDFVDDDSNDASPSHDPVVDSSSSEHTYCAGLNGEECVVKQGKTESSVIFDEQGALVGAEHEFLQKSEIVYLEDKILGEHEFSDEVQSSRNSSDDFWASIHKYDDYSSRDDEFDYDSDEIFRDISFSEVLKPETPMDLRDKREDYNEDSLKSVDDIPFDQGNSHLGDVNFENKHEAPNSHETEMKPQSLTSVAHTEEHISSDKFSDSDEDFDHKNSSFEDVKGVDASKRCDGEGDQTGEDVLLEQKELIRQMKREMRRLKISGLPTILEESESNRVEDDLRPLKIDERIGHKDRMNEIQTLYRMYLDKMRKLDILSQQTMYAIGLLQLKTQDELASHKKVSVPVIKSLLAQNFWSNKLRRHEADPVQKLIRGFQRDLEVVYVGQLCLSWETLKWQHQKAQQLHAHDPDGFRQHNQVAGEFQKFQVLLQRFTEDEPFDHGPRVQHYVKSRCALPTLLQVPLIKDDPRTEWRGKGEDGISIGMLKEVIGASMRAFWEFLRADKDEVHAMSLMGIHGHHVELQDPLDAELLVEIRSSLQKKEKRLKDLRKSGNCIVKKLQKNRDSQLSHEMFLAQVELRLVSRVLNMARLTTDQLLWCHKKMSKINIVGRKIYLESSFLLFPC